MSTAPRSLRNQQGFVLITTLLLLILLTGVGLASLATFDTNRRQSQSLVATIQAFNLADAGIQYAVKYLNQHQVLWGSYASSTAQTLIPATSLSGLGTFTVTVQDGGSGSLQITSTGATPNGAQSVITALIAIGSYKPEDALTTDQDLAINASMTLAGTNGGMHADGNLTITQSPTVSTNATAFGTYTNTGTPQIAGVAAGNQYVAAIPLILPPSFTSFADYILSWDGNVYDQQGVAQAQPGGQWNCWTFSSNATAQTWTLNCASTINGTFYFKTDVAIVSSAGTSLSPWISTIIAEGNIHVVTDNLFMRAPTTSEGALFKASTQNFQLVAGQDILIEGGLHQSFQGIIVAGEQVQIKTSPIINGYILAQDITSSSALVTANSIDGQLSLTYNGDIPAPATILKTAQAQTWKVQ